VAAYPAVVRLLRLEVGEGRGGRKGGDGKVGEVFFLRSGKALYASEALSFGENEYGTVLYMY
jgi:hypothetical protein